LLAIQQPGNTHGIYQSGPCFARLIFGARADLSLILLPIMFYHPFQFFVNGFLANQWAKERRR
jgi:sodium/bile acid cotransporter 7